MRALMALAKGANGCKHFGRPSRLWPATLALLCCASPALAADFNWSAAPANGNYDSGANWVGGVAPIDATSTAIFGASTITDLFFASPTPTQVGGWRFTGSDDYTAAVVDQDLQFLDSGIAVEGGSITFNLSGTNTLLDFENGATSGSATINVNSFGSSVTYGNGFGERTNAGTSVINVNTGSLGFFGGNAFGLLGSSAANATITANTVGFTGASVSFRELSTAGEAEITLNGSLTTLSFQEESTAEEATIVANTGARISFEDDSKAGTSHIVLNNSASIAVLSFLNNSSADDATITAHAFTIVEFLDASKAGTSNIAVDATGGFASGVNFSGTSSAEDASITVTAGSAVRFADNSRAGTADITLNGGPAGGAGLELAGDSSADDAVVTAGGINANVTFTDQASGGDARFIMNASSLFTIAGLSAAGTSAGSIEGAGTFDLGTKALAVGSNDLSTEVSGTIGGTTGSLTKVGTGTLTLSGSNTYEGETVVEGGVLELNTTDHTSHVRVESGGTLAGIGRFGVPLVGPGGLEVKSGGILAPGSASGGIGELTVNGSVLLQAGSHFRVGVNAAGGTGRLVVAFGTMDLTGAILDVIAAGGNYALSTSYTIIEKDGLAVTGTFASVNSHLAFLTPSVDYAAGIGNNDVVLTMKRNLVDFSDVAETPNQAAVAHALGQLPLDDPLAVALLNQDASGARQAFDALSGEAHASIAGMLVDQTSFVRDAILARLAQASYGGGATNLAALAQGGPTTIAGLEGAPLPGMMSLGMGERDAATGPGPESGLAFWTQGFGSWGDFDGDGNAASLDRTLGGFVSGVDGNLGQGWRAGVAVGYTQTDASVAARLSSAEIDSYHLAAYAGGRLGALALRMGGAWTWNDIDTERTIVFPGFADHTQASYDADTGQVFGEVALPFAPGGVALEPFVGLAYVYASTDGFTEDGGIAALTSSGTDQDVGYSRLGLRAAGTLLADGMVLIPHASAAWQHAFDDVTPDMALAFVGPGAGFRIAGTPIAQDSALLEAGIDLRIAPDARVGISYQGQVGDDVVDHGLNGRLNWRF